MSEAAVHPVESKDDLLEALCKVARMFDPMPLIRDEAIAADMARCLDAVLTPIARGRGALDVAIGEGLDALSKGNLVLRLGYSGIGDYAREELGINASTAQKMARFARKLRARPSLRAAVRAGEVSVRRADAVMPVAIGDAEEYWVEKARCNPVRALKAMAKRPVEDDPEEEKLGLLYAELSPAQRASLEKATEVAGRILGANAPPRRRYEALFQEYASAFATPEDYDAVSWMVGAPPADDGLEAAKEFLEKESRRWAALSQLVPIAAPWADPDAQRDPFLLHDELRANVRKRERWDDEFGPLALLFRRIRGWWFLEFTSFGHYCEERLGMGERTVQQRVGFQRRLRYLPSLARAVRERRLSYEKARIIARYVRHLDRDSLIVWIDCATRMTCIDLRRALEGARDAQMCARGMVKVPMPLDTMKLGEVALRAARRQAGRWISDGEGLRMIADHFTAVWEPVLAARRTAHHQILERDKGLCQVPGCSRKADHNHHIKFRSAGGGDERENCISLCAIHHLQCVHHGWVRVWGKAPDELHWQLGVRPGRPPLREFVSTPDGYVAALKPISDSAETLIH